MKTADSSHQPVFDVQIDDAYQRLRSALTAAMHTVRGGPTFPQDLARFLKINKNLAWRVSKIIDLHTPEQGIVHLPGPQGMKLLLKATESAGASREIIQQVSDAHENFLDVIKLHAGNNERLELLLDCRPDESGSGSLMTSRRIAYQGNSGVCGMQADTKLTAFFLAPSQDNPDLIDTLLLTGYSNIIRLRDIENILLFRVRNFTQKSDPTKAHETYGMKESSYELFDDVAGFENAHLSLVEEENNLRLIVGRGRVGLSGQSSVFFSNKLFGSVNRYAVKDNDGIRMESTIEVPIKTQVFDVFVHRDLKNPGHTKLDLFHLPAGGLHVSDAAVGRERLPVEMMPQLLPGNPDACAISALPGYADYVRRATAGTGFNLDEFTCVRFQVDYPPMHSTVSVKYPLTETKPE